MRLSDGFLDDLRTRLSLAQVVGKKVVWDSKKSQTGKGDYWSPCPFHQEKTASFHVDDKKGFYYCFGCHAKGNLYKFVQETENVSFMEAVKILATEAGMPMPQMDAKSQAKADRNQVLREAVETAHKFFKICLKGAKAEHARTYLKSRGLTGRDAKDFGIGYAPNDRNQLYLHLKNQNIPDDIIFDAGLCAKPEDGGAPYDRFRDRIVFPIYDPRMRCIAFGGRALSANISAKYLNSPETTIFDKGRTLYNFAAAREAAGKSGQLIVAEGYMDVIALIKGGFSASVAPLGTAITPDQLALMWRLSDVPTIALDGDTAGIRAGYRLLDLALPLLESGKSLQFCMLPEGMDPDDFIKNKGPSAFLDLLENSKSVIDLIWNREIDGKNFDNPDDRARFDTAIKLVLNRIKDANLRKHYFSAVADRRQILFARKTAKRTAWVPRAGYSKAPLGPSQSAKSSNLATNARGNAMHNTVRDTAILLGLLHHPDVALLVQSDLERCDFSDPDLQKIKDAILYILPDFLSKSDIDTVSFLEEVKSYSGLEPIRKLEQKDLVRTHSFLAPTASKIDVKLRISQAIQLHLAELGTRLEIRDATKEIETSDDERITWRFKQASLARDTARKRVNDLETNKVTTDVEDPDYFQKLLDSEDLKKKK